MIGWAQSIGVGTQTPNSSALLDIQSTNKGVLIPRMTTVQRDSIVSPAAGLQILNLDDYCLDIYDGDGWIKNCGLRVVGTDTATCTVEPIASFGGIARAHAVSFSINTKGYVGTGFDGTNRKKDFWEYNPATNVWTQKADFGGTARERAAGFAAQGHGFIGTGWDGQYKNDFWRYERASNMWTLKAFVPGSPGRMEAVGFTVGTSGFIGLGINPSANQYLFDMWEYSVGNDTWYQKTYCPAKIRRAVAFGISTGVSFIGTGIVRVGTFDQYTNAFYMFNPAGSGTWTYIANFPGGLRAEAVGFSIGTHGFVGTGVDYNGNYFNDMWEYDPSADAWKPRPAIGTVERAGAVAFAIGGTGYIGTGFDGGYMSDFMAFEPYPIGPVYKTSLDVESGGGIDDGIWQKELEQISTAHRINIAAAPRSLSHPDSRPFYFSGDIGHSSDGVEFRRSDGRQGIGFGYEYIYAAGNDVSQSLGIAAKGSDGYILFAAGGYQRLCINPDGYLGIGALFPHALLQMPNTDMNRKMVLFEGVNNDQQYSGFGTIGGSMRYQVNATTSDHVFFAGADATTSNELMRIKGSGQVGLGILAPMNKLDINSGAIRTGTHATGLPLYVTGIASPSSGGAEFRHINGAQGVGIGYNTIYAAGSDAFQNIGLAAKGATGSILLTTNNAERVRINGSGDMGVGINNPLNRLDIAYGVTRSGTHATGLPLYVTGIVGPASGGAEFRHANGTQGIGIGYNTIYAAGSDANHSLALSAKGAAGHLQFITNGTEKMRITPDGKVGIGVTAPHAQLQLATSVANRKIILYEVADNDHEFHGFGIDGYGALRYQTATTANDHVFVAATSPTESIDLMRIRGNGNVAISGVVETEAFIAPTLLNNFTNYGSDHATAAYYKDKMGRVFLRGLVNNVNNPTGLVVFTLPVGYRPTTSGHLVFATIANNGMGRVDVLANGNVIVNLGTAGWISLDNISFRTD